MRQPRALKTTDIGKSFFILGNFIYNLQLFNKCLFEINKENKINRSQELPIKSFNKKSFGLGSQTLSGWEFFF